MKKYKKIVFLDFIYILFAIFLFREKCFPLVGIGIVVLGILLFKFCNQKPN